MIGLCCVDRLDFGLIVVQLRMKEEHRATTFSRMFIIQSAIVYLLGWVMLTDEVFILETESLKIGTMIHIFTTVPMSP